MVEAYNKQIILKIEVIAVKVSKGSTYYIIFMNKKMMMDVVTMGNIMNGKIQNLRKEKISWQHSTIFENDSYIVQVILLKFKQ